VTQSSCLVSRNTGTFHSPTGKLVLLNGWADGLLAGLMQSSSESLFFVQVSGGCEVVVLEAAGAMVWLLFKVSINFPELVFGKI